MGSRTRGEPIRRISCTSLDPLGLCAGEVEFTGDLGDTAVDPAFAFVFGPGGQLERGKCQLPSFDPFFTLPRSYVTSYPIPGVHTVTATLFACHDNPNNPSGPRIPTGEVLATTTLDITVLPDKKQDQFALFLGVDGSGNTLVHPFDDSTASINVPFQVKLGQKFPVEIAPANPDGTLGSPFVVTEEILNATPGDILGGSSIPGTVTTLFQGRVLLHFANSQSETHHDFFPIHSGTATVKLSFTFNGTTHNLTFPVIVTSCVANGNCDPHLGSSNPQFDGLLMAFADRGGIPPQVIKAQIAQESAFNPNAYRYEPLSYDFRYNRNGTLTVPAALKPWSLAQSNNCTTDPGVSGNIPAGANIDLSSSDVTPRQRIYGVFTDANGSPLCHVAQIPQSPVAAAITVDESVLSMENILYTNDACFFHSICAGWATINVRSFDPFTDFQVTHPPFTGQTVIASSYGLHQLMYETAVVTMGFAQNGVGLPPHQLFDPFISLDLGSRYLAQKYVDRHLLQNGDFPDASAFFFQFGPALRDYNGPPRLTFGDIFDTCGKTPYMADPADPNGFDYPCLILQASPKYSPSPLEVNQ